MCKSYSCNIQNVFHYMANMKYVGHETIITIDTLSLHLVILPKDKKIFLWHGLHKYKRLQMQYRM